MPAETSEGMAGAQCVRRRLAVPEVADPWQKLPDAAAERGAGGAADRWRGLTVPDDRDTHFFVRSMAELHGCYGNE